MLMILWLFLIGLGIFLRKSKTVAVLQIAFIVSMIAMNTNNPDRSQYYSLFLRLSSGTTSIFNGNIVSNILFKAFSAFGSYEIVLFGISIICMFLIYKSIVFYTNQVAFVLSLYLIASFTIDATQIKNFIAMSIWLFFSRYLFLTYSYDEKRRMHLALYLLGCILATGAHFSFIYMVLFVFVIFLRDRNIGIKTILVCILAALLIYNIDYILRFISGIDLSFFALTTRKITDYGLSFNQQNMLVRMRRTIEVFVIMILLIRFCKVTERKKGSETDRYIEYLMNLVFISLFSLAFMKYSLEIYRIQRNLLIMFYVLFAKQNVFEENKTSLRMVTIEPYTFMGIFLSSIYLVLDSILGNFDTVFRTLFRI